MGAYTYQTSDLLVTSIEKNEIKQNSPETLPLNPTGQGFSGQEVRRRLSHSIVGEEGSLLSLFTMRMQIAKDILDNVFEQVENLKNDLELEAERLDGEVIRVEQKADAHIEDVDNPHGVTAEQVDTYVKTTIDNKDTNTLDSAKSYADSLVPDLSGIEQDITNLESGKLDKIWNDITSQSLTNLNDEFVLNRGGVVYKATLANMLSSVVPTDIFTVVAELPEAGLPNKIYLVPSSEPETQNALDEFIWVDNDWEMIGNVSVDLSNYFNRAEINSMLDDKVDKLAGRGLSTNDYTTDEKDKLAGIDTGAQVNVQSDWNESGDTKDSYIQNKPTIPTVPTNVSAFTNDAGYLTSHQSLSNYYTKTEIDDLDLGDKNVQSDWNQTNDTADDYIKNKPAIPTKVSALTNDTGYITGYTETDPIFTAWNKSTGISITKSQVSDLIEATQSLSGLMSATDKQRLDVLHALLEEDTENNVVDSINEVLAIFNNYPEGADLLTALAGKVDKVADMGLSKNDFTDEYKNKVDDVIDDVSQLQTGKQDKLVAGDNITIDESTNVISASAPTISNDIILDKTSTTKTASPKAVYEYVADILGDLASLLALI